MRTNTLAAPATTTPPAEKAWCPTCRTRATVEERFTDSHYERRGEVEYGVTALACGHTTEAGHHIVGAAPGNPWAGYTPTPTTRTTDRLAVAARTTRIEGDRQ